MAPGGVRRRKRQSYALATRVVPQQGDRIEPADGSQMGTLIIVEVARREGAGNLRGRKVQTIIERGSACVSEDRNSLNPLDEAYHVLQPVSVYIEHRDCMSSEPFGHLAG